MLNDVFVSDVPGLVGLSVLSQRSRSLKLYACFGPKFHVLWFHGGTSSTENLTGILRKTN